MRGNVCRGCIFGVTTSIHSLSRVRNLLVKPASFSGQSSAIRKTILHAFRCCATKSDDHTRPVTVPKMFVQKLSFCSACGGAIEERIPEGEHEKRAVCTVCRSVHYQNPKMVVGCLVEHENKVLLCRRSIQPSYGLWTLPAGYMELGESAAEGAVRETLEEAQAQVLPISLFAHLDIPLIGQSYIIFRAKFKDSHQHFCAGPESLECQMFALEEIPFEHIAFSSISVALKLYVEDHSKGQFKVHCGVIEKRPGATPSDPKGFLLKNHLQM